MLSTGPNISFAQQVNHLSQQLEQLEASETDLINVDNKGDLQVKNAGWFAALGSWVSLAQDPTKQMLQGLHAASQAEYSRKVTLVTEDQLTVGEMRKHLDTLKNTEKYIHDAVIDILSKQDATSVQQAKALIYTSRLSFTSKIKAVDAILQDLSQSSALSAYGNAFVSLQEELNAHQAEISLYQQEEALTPQNQAHHETIPLQKDIPAQFEPAVALNPEIKHKLLTTYKYTRDELDNIQQDHNFIELLNQTHENGTGIYDLAMQGRSLAQAHTQSGHKRTTTHQGLPEDLCTALLEVYYFTEENLNTVSRNPNFVRSLNDGYGKPGFSDLATDIRSQINPSTIQKSTATQAPVSATPGKPAAQRPDSQVIWHTTAAFPILNQGLTLAALPENQRNEVFAQRCEQLLALQPGVIILDGELFQQFNELIDVLQYGQAYQLLTVEQVKSLLFKFDDWVKYSLSSAIAHWNNGAIHGYLDWLEVAFPKFSSQAMRDNLQLHASRKPPSPVIQRNRVPDQSPVVFDQVMHSLAVSRNLQGSLRRQEPSTNAAPQQAQITSQIRVTPAQENPHQDYLMSLAPDQYLRTPKGQQFKEGELPEYLAALEREKREADSPQQSLTSNEPIHEYVSEGINAEIRAQAELQRQQNQVSRTVTSRTVNFNRKADYSMRVGDNQVNVWMICNAEEQGLDPLLLRECDFGKNHKFCVQFQEGQLPEYRNFIDRFIKDDRFQGNMSAAAGFGDKYNVLMYVRNKTNNENHSG